MLFVVTAAAAMLAIAGCDYLEKLLSGAYIDKWANLVNETSHEAVVNGNTLTYGSHTYTIVSEIDVNTTDFSRPTASVSFSNIPSGYTEFSAVYQNLLGKSLAGTVAMVPMAMEIYARDAATGEKCIKLLCYGGAASEMITELKRKIVPSDAGPEDDSYIQRYIPAALLKGATPSNSYEPSYPYSVQVTMSPNGVKPANLYGGDVTYMYIITSGGWSTFQRGVDVFQQSGSTQYKIFGCPGCYSQCATISGDWNGLK